MIVKTHYGDLDKTSVYLYYEELKNRTFSLLYLYEQQPFETFKNKLQELICGVISFQKILIQRHPDFCRYIENLASIIEPQPLSNETEHDFVKKRVLNAVNLVDRILTDVAKAVEDGK